MTHENSEQIPACEIQGSCRLRHGNSTINISPVAGLLCSNQAGGGDKVLAEFKNATSYITLQGDKICCNNTSDDSLKQLDLTNNNAGRKNE